MCERSGVTVRCVKCSRERVIAPGELGADYYPMCESCYTPMMPVRATARVTDLAGQPVPGYSDEPPSWISGRDVDDGDYIAERIAQRDDAPPEPFE